MKILEKKAVALLIMSLTIIISLLFDAKMPIGKSFTILLILLGVFAVIDYIFKVKFFTKKQAQYTSIAVSVIAIVLIGVYGMFTGSATGEGHIDQGSTISETDEAYELGLFYFERGDYEESIKSLKNVADSSSAYLDAQKLLSDATDQYRAGLLDTANEYINKDDYSVAIDILTAGLLVIPEDAKLLQSIDNYSSQYTDVVRTTAIADAGTYAGNEDYASAFVAIQGAIDKIGSDVELLALYDDYTNQYREKILTDARRAYVEQGFQPSLSIIQSGLELLPDDKELMEYYDIFLSHKPVRLNDLVKIDESDRYFSSYDSRQISDLLENDPIDSRYSFGNDGWSGYLSGTGWVEFFLNKEYSSFQCSFLTRSIGPIYIFSIYGDEAELYNSGEVNWEAGRQDITVNVENVSKLKIVVTWSDGGTGDYGIFFMGNDSLYKKLTDANFNEIQNVGS